MPKKKTVKKPAKKASTKKPAKKTVRASSTKKTAKKPTKKTTTRKPRAKTVAAPAVVPAVQPVVDASGVVMIVPVTSQVSS